MDDSSCLLICGLSLFILSFSLTEVPKLNIQTLFCLNIPWDGGMDDFHVISSSTVFPQALDGNSKCSRIAFSMELLASH